MRKLAPFISYITVMIGLFVFHNAWIAIFALHLSMVVFLSRSGYSISLANFRNNNYKALSISFAFGIIGGILLLLLWPYLGISADINRYLQQVGLTAASWPFFIMYFIMANALLEELYWRGYLGSDSRRLTANDILFSGYHVLVLAGKTNVAWLCVIFLLLALAAWFWRQADRWNKGLMASVLSHLAADASVIITLYYMTTA